MIGYKVTLKEHSGLVEGDDVVYTTKPAADFVYDLYADEQRNFARQEEAPETKIETVEYEVMPHDVTQCRVGRMLHQLNVESREAMVARAAYSKLNSEERRALNLKDPDAPGDF